MTTQNIVDRFALISGLSNEKANTLTYICDDAKNEIISKLLPDVDIDSHSERLIAAAAALSLYKYMQYKALDQTTESFSAGDITVKENTQKVVDVALEIWNDEKAKIADILQDDDFVFWQVN